MPGPLDDQDFERDEYFQADAEDRRAALAAAVTVSDQFTGAVHRADAFYNWLRSRPSIVPVSIRVGNPAIAPQDNPSAGVQYTRGAGMAVTMMDSQVATYPPAEAVDSKGFAVPADQISVSEDSGGAVVTLVVADGSDPAVPAGTAAFTAVAPGSAQATWSDGAGNSFVDSINVTPGGVAGIQVGAPVVTDQAPPVGP